MDGAQKSWFTDSVVDDAVVKVATLPGSRIDSINAPILLGARWFSSRLYYKESSERNPPFKWKYLVRAHTIDPNEQR